MVETTKKERTRTHEPKERTTQINIDRKGYKTPKCNI